MDTDRNAFLESQAKFNALLGSAQAKSEIGLKNINSFYNTPSEFAVTGEQFVNLLDNFNSQAAGEEEIMDVTTAFRIPTSEKLKFMQPNELAQEAVDVILGPKKNDFSPDGVSFNKSQAIDFAQNQWLPSMLTPGSDAYNKAIIYGARNIGWKNLNKRPLSASDVEELISLPQDQKDLLLGEYVNDTMNQIRQTVPNSIGEYKQENAGNRTEREKRLATLKFNPQDLQQTVTKSGSSKKSIVQENVNMYVLPSDMWIKTDKGESITRFGVGGNNSIWIKKSKVDPITKQVIDLGIKKATNDEKNYLRAELGDFYDVYLSKKDPAGVL